MPKEPTPRIKIFSLDQLEEMTALGLDPMDVAINSGYDDYEIESTVGPPNMPNYPRIFRTGGMVKKYYSHGSKAKKKIKRKQNGNNMVASLYKGFK